MYFTTQPFEEHWHDPDVGRAIFDLTNGPQSWLYASDYPHHDFDVPGLIWGTSYLTEAEKRAVLGENALKLFNLPNDLPTRTTAQYPGVNGHATYTEGLSVGYRWYDTQGSTPLFPFGHGMSYTTFSYSPVSVSRTTDGASVTFTLTNAGHRAGAEVPQVYVADPISAGEPPKQLKGYQKVFLNPGQSTTITIPLDARAFAHWDTTQHTWVIDQGTYQILLGSSSRDIRGQSSITLGPRSLTP